MAAALYRTLAGFLIAWPLSLACVQILHAGDLEAWGIGMSLGFGFTTLLHVAASWGPGRG